MEAPGNPPWMGGSAVWGLGFELVWMGRVQAGQRRGTGSEFSWGSKKWGKKQADLNWEKVEDHTEGLREAFWLSVSNLAASGVSPQ